VVRTHTRRSVAVMQDVASSRDRSVRQHVRYTMGFPCFSRITELAVPGYRWPKSAGPKPAASSHLTEDVAPEFLSDWAPPFRKTRTTSPALSGDRVKNQPADTAGACVTVSVISVCIAGHLWCRSPALPRRGAFMVLDCTPDVDVFVSTAIGSEAQR
jgi:hypothetical protein